MRVQSRTSSVIETNKPGTGSIRTGHRHAHDCDTTRFQVGDWRNATSRLLNGIDVALLAEIEPAVLREAHFVRPPRDERVKDARSAVRIWSENAPKPLGLFLTRTEVAGDLNCDAR